jgi:sporulation integral membrane protein YtvI
VQLVGLLSFIQDNGPLIQAWVMNVTQSVQDTISMLPYNAGDQINQIIIEYIDGISHINVASKLLAYTYSLSTAIPNFFLLTLIYLISVILFSFQLDNLRRGFYSFFKEKTKQKIILVLRDLRQAAMGFIKALIILSTITFILSFIGLMILQVKYSAIIALVIVLFDILPIIGPGSILVPWAVISLFRGDIFTGIGLLILFLIITVVRRSIEPKILGERIGLTGLATLISLWIGFKVMGVLGIFLFPLALIFYKALVKAKIININYKF